MNVRARTMRFRGARPAGALWKSSKAEAKQGSRDFDLRKNSVFIEFGATALRELLCAPM